MARNEHKRQQKLIKKQRRANSIKKERNKSHNLSNRELILSASKAPWIACYAEGEDGINTVFAIRQTRRGTVACAFLVDMYCLGVKDCFFNKDFDLEAFRERRESGEDSPVSPAYALKLINEAIAYAQGIGFEPHPETSMCKLIFGDTDATECKQEFTFGKDGKPLYMSGPYDDAAKRQRIYNTLSKLGEGNFGFIIREDIDEMDDEYDVRTTAKLGKWGFDVEDDFDDEFESEEDYFDSEDSDESTEPSNSSSDTVDALEVRQKD